MSVLQVANVWFESTGGSRIDYDSANTLIRIVAPGSGVVVPAGTTAQRPTANAVGTFRYNSTIDDFEIFTNSYEWKKFSGARGGGTDKIFFENGTTITSNYTITSGYNAGTFGPVTINDNIEVTILDGSEWTVT
jgi:hypothetical protein